MKNKIGKFICWLLGGHWRYFKREYGISFPIGAKCPYCGFVCELRKPYKIKTY